MSLDVILVPSVLAILVFKIIQGLNQVLAHNKKFTDVFKIAFIPSNIDYGKTSESNYLEERRFGLLYQNDPLNIYYDN